MACGCPPKTPCGCAPSEPSASIFGELGSLVPVFRDIIEGGEQKKRDNRDFAKHARAMFAALDPREAAIFAAAAAGHEAARAVMVLNLAPDSPDPRDVILTPWDLAPPYEIEHAVAAARVIADNGTMADYVETKRRQSIEHLPVQFRETALKQMPPRSARSLFIDRVFEGVVGEVLANCIGEEEAELEDKPKERPF